MFQIRDYAARYVCPLTRTDYLLGLKPEDEQTFFSLPT